jgi:hypothetical protein
MHVLYAAAILALNSVCIMAVSILLANLLAQARQRFQRALKTEPKWPLSRLEMIISSLGGRANNSLISG